MNSIFLSIIIPIYNGENVIARCLDSIFGINLSNDSYEVIVVDDCSTDDTIRILYEYAANHNNLKIVRQVENHRQGAARNRGITLARGSYLMFVDGDDAIDDGLINAINIAGHNNPDVLAMAHVVQSSDGSASESKRLSLNVADTISGKQFIEDYPYWCSAPWGYLFKTDFVKAVNYPFAENVYCEDSDFVMTHLLHAERVSFAPGSCYKYMYNNSSTTNSWSYKIAADYFLLGTRMCSIHEKMDNEEISAKYSQIILEGGSYNIFKSLLSLLKKAKLSEARNYYERVDKYADRNHYRQYRQPAYCWTVWTRLCIKHKVVALAIIALIQPARFLYLFIKKTLKIYLF